MAFQRQGNRSRVARGPFAFGGTLCRLITRTVEQGDDSLTPDENGAVQINSRRKKGSAASRPPSNSIPVVSRSSGDLFRR